LLRLPSCSVAKARGSVRQFKKANGKNVDE
jgi:hypothetical protein